MKTLYLLLGAAAMSGVLFSCAGAPAAGGNTNVVEISDTGESTAKVTVTPEVHKYTVLRKPETVVFSYIDGSIDKTVSYEYDDMGRELLSEETDAQGDVLSIHKTFYEQGVISREEDYDARGLIGITVFETDSDGKIIRQVRQNEEGENVSFVSYEYDGDFLKTSTAYDSDEIPSLISVYSYRDGELESIEYRLPDGSEDARLMRTFENGRVTGEKVVLPDGSVETAREFEYTDGVLSGETQFSGTVKIKSVHYEYDENGNIIREVWSDRRGHEYEVIERSWLRFEISE